MGLQGIQLAAIRGQLSKGGIAGPERCARMPGVNIFPAWQPGDFFCM